MEQALELFTRLIHLPAVRVGAILAGSLLAALVVKLLFNRVVHAFTQRTRTEIDDRLAEILQRPAMVVVVLVGLVWAALELKLEGLPRFVTLGLLQTLIVINVGGAAMRAGTVVLEALSVQADRVDWVQPKTVPVLEIVMKVLVIGGALYFLFLAWNINVTSWLASAGIVGIAVGFAAKDTLANLFAGIFIIADAPYKIGDFIILDGSLRGLVTDIGVRSTRILTRDDIEVTVPNAVIANAKIINETSGPHPKMRVRVNVFANYGCDVDQVREVLLKCARDVEHVEADPEPRVRFREFGDSGLRFELLAWISEPVFRGRVLDALNTRVYKAFNEAGIEIPYSKHDVYIKEGGSAAPDDA